LEPSVLPCVELSTLARVDESRAWLMALASERARTSTCKTPQERARVMNIRTNTRSQFRVFDGECEHQLKAMCVSEMQKKNDAMHVRTEMREQRSDAHAILNELRKQACVAPAHMPAMIV
jgi:hypothetical protein